MIINLIGVAFGAVIGWNISKVLTEAIIGDNKDKPDH